MTAPHLILKIAFLIGIALMLVVGLYARHSMVPSFIFIAAIMIGHVRWQRGFWPLPSPLIMAAIGVLTVTTVMQTLLGGTCNRCAALSWQMVPFIWLIGFAAAAAPLSILADPKNRSHVFAWVLAIAAITACLLVVELLFDAPIYRWAAGRMPADIVGLARYNRTAALLSLIIWPCAGWYLATTQTRSRERRCRVWQRGWPHVICGFAVILTVNALSDSETSTIGLILAAVFITLFQRMIGLGLLAVMVTAVALLVCFQQLASVLPEVLPYDRGLWPDSLWHRFEIWQHAATAIAERPWGGWGFDGYREIPLDPALAEAARFMTETPTHPHNAGLQLRVELGVIGSLIGVLVVLAIARVIWASPPRLRLWGLGAAVTAAVIAEVAYGLWQGSWLAMIGLTCVLYGLLTAAETPTADQETKSDKSV